jgi:predicted transport protein
LSTVDDATATMISNFPARTGRPLDEWVALVRSSGRARHGEIMALLKTERGMSHGFANLVALTALRPDDAASGDDLVEAIYTGPKADLRPLHDAAVKAATAFGPDVELAPKKSYVSLRRSKQFATVGPGPGGRLEIGLNLRDVEPQGRLETTTGMCTHRVRIASREELDPEVLGWLRQAYDGA